MPTEALRRLREKYPQYQHIPDQELARRIIAKYPQYRQALGDDAVGPVTPSEAGRTLSQRRGTLGSFVRSAQAGYQTPTARDVLNFSSIGIPGGGLGMAAGKFVGGAIQAYGAIPKAQRAMELLGLPRALKASADLSAPFRQGLVALVRYPKQWARAWGPMLRAAASEEGYAAVKNEIARRPTLALMRKAGVALTALDEDLPELLAREEQFVSRLAESIPGGIGKVVRASNRAYSGFLTKVRADVFDDLLQRAKDAYGREAIIDEKLLADIGRWVNTATGRGDLGKLKNHAATLSATLFSPRFIASRLELLSGAYLRGGVDPLVRKEALWATINLAAAGATVVGASVAAGARTSLNPNSADFGKIIIGDTRIDPWGGFQQYAVFASRMATGQGSPWFHGAKFPQARGATTLRFGENKLQPIAGAAADLLFGDWRGRRTPVPQQAKDLLMPILLQDLQALAREHPGDFAALGLTLGLGTVGVGVQTYSREPNRRRARP